jgi:hypothetical protein
MPLYRKGTTMCDLMQRAPAHLALGLVLLVGLAGSAWAVDGVIEINQVRALAGGVSPGDAAGFPVTISQAGSYRLTDNLTVPNVNTTAIEVDASQVSIDLNGFSIIGPNSCVGCPATCAASGFGRGIFTANSIRNLTVRNGTIRGMGGSGILLGFGATAILEGMTLDQNGAGGFEGGSGTATNSFASANLGVGFASGGGRFSSNTSACNGSTGILLFAGEVSGNHVVQNKGDGIKVDSEAAILNNNANNNGGCGIRAVNSQVSHNTLDSNGTCGIKVTGSGTLIGNNVNGGNCPALDLSPKVGFVHNVLSTLNCNIGCSAVLGGVEMGTNVCEGVAYDPFHNRELTGPLCGPCIR